MDQRGLLLKFLLMNCGNESAKGSSTHSILGGNVWTYQCHQTHQCCMPFPFFNVLLSSLISSIFLKLADPTLATMDFVIARAAYDDLVKTYTPPTNGNIEPPLPFEAVMSDTQSTPLAAHLERASRYARRLSATSASYPTGHGFINGKHHDFNDVCWVVLYNARD